MNTFPRTLAVILTLSWLIAVPRSFGDQTNSAASGIADRPTYLLDFSQAASRQWPSNRTLNIVCHGHSVPAGYAKTPLVNTFDAYPHLLHQKLKERFPYAIINVIVTAKGGERSDQGAERFVRDVLSHQPDLVTLDYALNDRGIGLEKAGEAWSAMIESSLRQGIKIILLTPTPDLRAKLDDPLDPINQHADQVRRLAARSHVGLVDSLELYREYVNNGGDWTNLLAQVNHPNRKGHEIVANALAGWFPR